MFSLLFSLVVGGLVSWGILRVFSREPAKDLRELVGRCPECGTRLEIHAGQYDGDFWREDRCETCGWVG